MKWIFDPALFRNKLYALALVLIGVLITVLDSDATALVLFLILGMPMFFAKENYIYESEGLRCSTDICRPFVGEEKKLLDLGQSRSNAQPARSQTVVFCMTESPCNSVCPGGHL